MGCPPGWSAASSRPYSHRCPHGDGAARAHPREKLRNGAGAAAHAHAQEHGAAGVDISCVREAADPDDTPEAGPARRARQDTGHPALAHPCAEAARSGPCAQAHRHLHGKGGQSRKQFTARPKSRHGARLETLAWQPHRPGAPARLKMPPHVQSSGISVTPAPGRAGGRTGRTSLPASRKLRASAAWSGCCSTASAHTGPGHSRHDLEACYTSGRPSRRAARRPLAARGTDGAPRHKSAGAPVRGSSAKAPRPGPGLEAGMRAGSVRLAAHTPPGLSRGPRSPRPNPRARFHQKDACTEAQTPCPQEGSQEAQCSARRSATARVG